MTIDHKHHFDHHWGMFSAQLENDSSYDIRSKLLFYLNNNKKINSLLRQKKV